MRKNNTKQRLPLKWKLFLSFCAFMAALIMLLWAFQIWLLDDFYLNITKNNLASVGKHLSAVSAEKLQTEADNAAFSNELCVLVFDTKGKRLASAEASGSCLIHKFGNNNLNKLVKKAIDNGGWAITPMVVDNMPGAPNDSGGVSKNEKRYDLSRLVYSAAVTTNDGNRLILLDCPLTPVMAIKKTLRIQLSVISLIAALIALAAAFILSRRISKPIVGLSESAVKLASGRYDTEFKGGGCREIDELSASLSFAAIELSKVDKMQRELIANISHDLRTPLTMISGYSEVMRDIPGENTPENIQVIIDETKRLNSLVNDLIEVSRLQSGTTELHPEVFSLTEALHTTVERFKKLNECKGYTIICETDGIANVHADSSAILQVLYNLIGNAISYTGENKTVTVTQRIVSGSVRIDVIDYGDGIPENELQNIWTRYYRIKDNHRRGIGGSGIGLSIVKGILEKHNADYGVLSTEGKGSDFWFTLPLAAANDTEEKANL